MNPVEFLLETGTYDFGEVVIIINNETQYLETQFQDGTYVPATANIDAESIARAHALGYDGDTWAMSREHEMCHTILSGGVSPTLWKIAHPNDTDVASDELIASEEAAVLAYQKFINTRRRENI